MLYGHIPRWFRERGLLRSFWLTAVASVLLSGAPGKAVAQAGSSQHSATAAVEGTVRDAAGKPMSGAFVIAVEARTPSKQDTAISRADGTYCFPALRAGNYTVWAQKSGSPDSNPRKLLVVGGDSTQLDLVVGPADQMSFSDSPNFTVAGVTDWTAVGGHGSDSILRTSEDLARETMALKAQGADSNSGGNDADRHRMAGELDEKAGDPLAAVQQYQQAVRLDPSEENYFAWGSELLLHRAVWQAAEVFRSGVRAHPKSARLLTGLGTALFAGARYDEAARSLCEAADLHPTNAEPYLFMGRVELAAPTALPCIEPKLAQFVQRNPDNSLANYFYAMALLKRQEHSADKAALEQVKTLLTKAVSLDAKCSAGYLQLGILAASRHDYEKAIQLYGKAIDADPQSGEAHYRLGVAYDHAGEREKAAREFQLHDEIEKRQAAAIERERRDVKQFVVEQAGAGAPLSH
jgi:tetratricopeptide (TPR) repeat protein